MTVEEILKKSGDFGPAQWCLLSLFSVVNIFSAFHYFAQTFITLQLKNVPSDHSFNCSEVTNCSESYLNQTLTWEFETLTNELNWTGDETWKSVVVQSTFFIGSVTGTYTLGVLADTFGRIPMLVVANILAFLGNIMTIYLYTSIWWLGIARFIAGLATDTNFFMMYIIVMEYIQSSMRTFGLNLCIGIWYCVGCMVIPWVAVVTQNWKNFLLSISVPALIIPLSCMFVPESAQWLLSIGRTEDAIECFRKLAKLNNKTLTDEFINNFKASISKSETQKKNRNMWGLFKTVRLRRNTCILIFKTMVLTLCYDAMSRNIEGLGLDPFKMFTVTSASIFPSCLIILFFQDKIGRKGMAVLSLFLTAVFNFVQGLLLVFGQNLTNIGFFAALFARFFVNIAYNSGTQYAAELIPTQVRGQGLAAMHVVGYSAVFCSPYILYLSNIWIATPESIIGLLSLSGAIFCLFLPETLNKSLPVTLQDGESFGKDENIRDFLKLKIKK